MATSKNVSKAYTNAAINASLNNKLNSAASNNTIWTTSTGTSGSGPSIPNSQTISVSPNTYTSNLYSGSYITTADLSSLYDDKSSAFVKLMMLTTEKRIEEIFDELITNQDTDDCKIIIRTAVRTRHFSEDFLIKYFDYLTLSDILVKHEENIKSHEYASLVLILTQKD